MRLYKLLVRQSSSDTSSCRFFHWNDLHEYAVDALGEQPKNNVLQELKSWLASMQVILSQTSDWGYSDFIEIKDGKSSIFFHLTVHHEPTKIVHVVHAKLLGDLLDQYIEASETENLGAFSPTIKAVFTDRKEADVYASEYQLVSDEPVSVTSIDLDKFVGYTCLAYWIYTIPIEEGAKKETCETGYTLGRKEDFRPSSEILKNSPFSTPVAIAATSYESSVEAKQLALSAREEYLMTEE